jgi:hypothetical protein
MALQRFVARIGGWPPARRAWARLYALAARFWVAMLARGTRASVYARGGLASGDLIPGLSDIDLVVVADSRPGAEVLRQRWERLRRLRPVRDLLDWPRIYDAAELARLRGSSALTYGLEEEQEEGPALDRERGGGAAYYGPDATLDGIRALERPGPEGVGYDWRLLRGAELRPPASPVVPGSATETIAAWLELLYLWRWVAAVCKQPSAPRAADLAVKLVADPARIWLRLERGEHVSDRREALELALSELSSEGALIEPALALAGRLDRLPAAPVAEILPGAVRLSVLVASAVSDRLSGAGHVRVRLEGAGEDRVRGLGGPPLPLVDWRAMVCPPDAEERFDVQRGGLADPGRIAATAGAPAQEPGVVGVLAEQGLIVQPSLSFLASRMRAIKARFSDPVSFALIEGAGEADFPAAAGWSIADWARRAIAEHRALLDSTAGGPGGAPRLGALLTAARAGVVHESVEAGEPAIPLTLDAVALRLDARADGGAAAGAVEARQRWIRSGEAPAPSAIDALERLVSSLPAYRRDR